MEVVAGVGRFIADLLLRTLRLRQHYRARVGDVHTISGRNYRSGGAAVPRGFIARLLFKSRRFIDALWYDAGANLLWRRLRQPTALVAVRPVGFGAEYFDLDDLRFWVVEDPAVVVGGFAYGA